MGAAVIQVIGPSDAQAKDIYQDVVFRNLIDHDSGRVIQNLDLQRCTFINSKLSSGLDPKKRTILRRLHLSHCCIKQRFAMVGAPILEHTTVEHLRCGDVLIFWGAAFQRVTLKGHMPPMIFHERMAGNAVPIECAERFREANGAFYTAVDWALDIRDAQFATVRLSSIPGQLIRRNPATQVMVSRSKLLERDWSKLPLPSITRVSVENCLASCHEYQVIVAGERSRTFAAQLEGLEILRREGFAAD